MQFHQEYSGRKTHLKPADTSPIKIGILRTSSIGDLVLATSCISLLKRLLPEAKILWLGKNPSLSLIEDAFPDIECVELAKALKINEVLKTLKDVSFLLDLQTNLRSRIISHAYKNRYRKPIFFCPKNQLQRNRLILESRIYGRKRQLPVRAIESLKPQYTQMSDSLLLALQTLNLVQKNFSLAKEDCVPFLPVDHYEDKKSFLKDMEGVRWIALSPGASYETKQAPLDLFADTLKKLQTQSGLAHLGLIFLGDQKDSELSKGLMQRIQWSGPIINFAGRLSLWENAVVLKKAVCLLGNDSALGHIAEAVETPVLTLFGPTVEGFGFAPRKTESRAFSSLLGCRPCSKHGKAPCRFGDKLCFSQISREDLALHISKLLHQNQQHVSVE